MFSHDVRILPHDPRYEVPRSGSRLYFVDHVRVALTVMVILQHLALTYGGVGPWYYQEATSDPVVPAVLTSLVLLFQAFFMGLFFLIAAYFVPDSFERKGFGGFIRDKVGRLAIPLLVYMCFLNPLAMLGFRFTQDSSTWPASLPYWQFYLISMTPGPLWFVQTLLLFCVLYAIYRRLAANHGPHPVSSTAPPGYRDATLLVVLLTAATFLFRIWIPIGLYVPVLDLPTLSHFPQYIGLFIVGILASRRNWFMTIGSNSKGLAGLVTAAVASVLLLPIAFLDLGKFTGGMHWQALVYALWESLVCLGMSVGLLVLFRHRFNEQGALGRFLSKHAYTVYVIHAPLIVGLAFALRDVEVFPLLKFVLVALLAPPLCYAGAYLVRRFPLASRVL